MRTWHWFKIGNFVFALRATNAAISTKSICIFQKRKKRNKFSEKEFYLEMSIQSNTAAILVTAGQRHKVELLGEGSSGCYWATFACLQACDVSRELRIYHRHLAVLNHEELWHKKWKKNFPSLCIQGMIRGQKLTLVFSADLDVLDCLAGVIGNNDIRRDFFAMIINFLVKSDFQIQFTLRKCESLRNQGARESASTGWWSVLEFLDCESDRWSFVALKIIKENQYFYFIKFNSSQFISYNISQNRSTRSILTFWIFLILRKITL